MKKTKYLIRVAEALGKKYASVDANTFKEEIQTAIYNDIKNAAVAQTQGIMNFPQMIQQDGTTIRFDVFRNDSLGMRNIKIFNFEVSKPENAAKYTPLAEQVKDYLTKNWELFPFKRNGEDVSYNNFSLNLTYAPEIKESPERIAGD
jgi:hypothetical protein